VQLGKTKNRIEAAKTAKQQTQRDSNGKQPRDMPPAFFVLQKIQKNLLKKLDI